MYPGNPGILKHRGYYTICMISQIVLGIPGILGYSDIGGLEGIILYVYIYIIYKYPRMLLGLPVYLGSPGILRYGGGGEGEGLEAYMYIYTHV